MYDRVVNNSVILSSECVGTIYIIMSLFNNWLFGNTYRGVYDSGKRISLVLMLLWEQLVFFLSDKSSFRKTVVGTEWP